MRFTLEDEESVGDEAERKAQDSGRVWLSPEEIACAHNQEPPWPMRALPAQAEARMRAAALRMIPRLLYTTYEFSPLAWRGVECSGCASL